MKACLRSPDGSCFHQLRLPLTTVGREGSDVIIQVREIDCSVKLYLNYLCSEFKIAFAFKVIVVIAKKLRIIFELCEIDGAVCLFLARYKLALIVFACRLFRIAVR